MGERWAKDECMVRGEWYYYVVRSSLKRRQSGQRSRGRSRELEVDFPRLMLPRQNQLLGLPKTVDRNNQHRP